MLEKYLKSILNKLPEVTWDRYSKGDGYICFFGWLDRKDQHKDYVEVTVWDDSDVSISTSSAKYSKEFSKRLGLDNHSDCLRVEDLFKSGVKCIKL